MYECPNCESNTFYRQCTVDQTVVTTGIGLKIEYEETQSCEDIECAACGATAEPHP